MCLDVQYWSAPKITLLKYTCKWFWQSLKNCVPSELPNFRTLSLPKVKLSTPLSKAWIEIKSDIICSFTKQKWRHIPIEKFGESLISVLVRKSGKELCLKASIGSYHRVLRTKSSYKILSMLWLYLPIHKEAVQRIIMQILDAGLKLIQ